MKIIPLEKYLKMRKSLLKEKTKLETRLADINAALGITEAPAAVPTPGQATKIKLVKGPRRKWKRMKNAMSLREAVLKVTARAALTKPEIIEAVQKLGYKFATDNPTNRLGVLLYGKKPKFKNDQGKFSAA
jgi:hypothetical protein